MRGREATEAMDVSGLEVPEGGEDDIVVDENHLLQSTTAAAIGSRDAVEKLLSIEQAILTSIERCRKC